MPVSPALDSEGAVRLSVTSNGGPVGDTIELISVQVQRALNRLPTARLVVADGNMPEGSWPVADGKTFEPGARIRLAAGHGSQEQPVFDGIVARLGLHIGADHASQLQVDCVHAAVVMTAERRSVLHADLTDGAALTGLITAHGLDAEVDATATPHAALAQIGCTDWDFLVARAAANGLLVVADDDRLRVQAPRTEAQPALCVTWGEDLLAFDAEAGPGGRGRLSFPGSAAAKVGDMIEIRGLGQRFGGKALIRALTHTLALGGWVTEVEFSLPPVGPQALGGGPAAGLAAAPAGAQPGAAGLQLGHVVAVSDDTAGEPRIRVQLPLLQAGHDTLWARLAQPQASQGFGSFFVPQVGDEVVLGFVGGDAANPVVLGSLYGRERRPPVAMDPQNGMLALTTRHGHRLVFDDPHKTLSVSTPAGNRVLLDDAAQSLRLQDPHDNTLTLDSRGITLETPKNLALKAGGAITLEATGTMGLHSQADLHCSGLNVACEAQVGFRGTGGAQAELSAAGQTVVKGAMVLIN